MNIETLIKKCEKDLTKDDIDLIYKAYLYALEHPKNKKRLNGDDYIVHPLSVALILTDLNIETSSICACLLHETINHGGSNKKELEELFGSDIASLVETISIMNKLELTDDSNAATLNFRKVLVGLAKDVRVLFIKMADRLHNLRTGDVLEKEALKRKVEETQTVLIPIAHRLGINAWKSEMEDWCLKYSKPEVYQDILEKLELSRKELEHDLMEMQDALSELLIEHNISFKIKSRVKSIYSIYNKLSNGKKWNQIYDILALRIIVEKVSECYLAVGLIHAKYRPIPGRFKDYIAMPKENMYQSLHTGVFGSDNHRYEVQIRTYEMDEIAEKGIASHWSYKEKGTKQIQNIMEQKLELFRSLIESSSNLANEDFTNQVQTDFLNECIYVFTPKGDVVELPRGSTPIDFAYRIHSKVGDTTIGAIVNDGIVTLDYELKNNDIIQIKTNPNSYPKKEWLNFVKSSHAKDKIKAYFSKQDKEQIIEKGKNLLQNELRKRKIPFEEILNTETIKVLCKEFHFDDISDLYFAIGTFRYTAQYIISFLNEDKKDITDTLILKANKVKSKDSKSKKDIKISGFDDILVNLALCCKPVLHDDIVGYVTKGNGVRVHRSDCDNIDHNEDRSILVSWNEDVSHLFDTTVHVEILNNQNGLLDIVSKATAKGIGISNVKSRTDDMLVKYELSVKVHNKEDLVLFMDSLSSIKGFRKVYR